MAETETKEKTVDQVKALAAEGKNAQEIAKALGKTPATVYNHMRNLGLGHGKRGRPKKSDAEKAKTQEAKGEVKTRPRPGSKTETTKSKPGPKPKVPADSNGHDATATAERFPKVAQAIEAELVEARSRVATLEGMLAAFSG